MKVLFYSILLSTATLLAAGEEIGRYPYIPSHHNIDKRAEETALDELLLLVQKRLSAMHELARWKWSQGRAIDEPLVERELVERFAWRAQEQGVCPHFARHFITAQIEAGKIVQRRDFEVWQSEGRDWVEADQEGRIKGYVEQLQEEMMPLLHRIQEMDFSVESLLPPSRRLEDRLDSVAFDTATLPFRVLGDCKATPEERDR